LLKTGIKRINLNFFLL